MLHRKINLLAILSAVLLAVAVVLYSQFFCSDFERCYDQEVKVFEPLFWGLLGLIPSLAILLFRKDIFVSWCKQIGWWYILILIYFVSTVNPYSGNVLSVDRSETVIFGMAILFVVTLVYVLIMKKRAS